jgi:Tfp pilus assembly protein PilF
MLAAIQQGDLRWLGNAKAMLDPWWTTKDLPSETLFVRALIRQGTHDFKGALADLDAAIAKDPRQPEHWAWRFAIYLVMADMTKARNECSAIGQRFGQSEQASCNAVLLYRTGYPEKAIVALEGLSRHPDYQGRLAQEWLAFHWGEAYRVAGDRAKARKIWETQLNKGTGGHSVRIALIDLLNSEKNYADAWKLNSTPPRSDALLVAAIQTSLGLNNGKDTELKSEFNQRLTQQRARGDSPNERPLIKFTLSVEGKAREALAMAQQAWKTEREPADALLYARAAIKSGMPEQAAELLQWQSMTGYKEPELDQLILQIRQAATAQTKR